MITTPVVVTPLEEVAEDSIVMTLNTRYLLRVSLRPGEIPARSSVC